MHPTATPHAPQHCLARAFTLIDLMMAIVIIGIMAAIVMPSLTPGDHVKLVAGATLVASDIEYAQSATLASPGDPTIVVFDPNSDDSYWLALASDPDTPIDRPNGGAYLVIVGEGTAAQIDSMTFQLIDADDGRSIAFDEFARLSQFADIRVRITNEVGELDIHIVADTGSVNIVDASK